MIQGTLPRLLAGVREDGSAMPLREHLRRHGELPPARGLVETAEAAGLTGRGGGGFPVARKLRAVGRARLVVANATEGEVVSGKDKVLLRCVPQLVLDGAVLAAAAVGARRVAVAVAAKARAEQAAVAAAIEERRRARTDGRISVELVAVPDGFVSGEETALVRAVERGGRALPAFGPKPFEQGILVQNAETLAHLALIARHGPEWFRSVGTREEPGSTLATVSGAVRAPGVYELALGTPFRDVIGAAGGPTEPLQAFLVGGYFGTWVAADAASRRSFLDADFGSLGARAVVALPQSACGVAETARIARWLAGESAGQCGPCLYGLDAIAGALEQLARGRGDTRPRVERWLDQVDGRGACRHPDGAARFVRSAFDVFARELALHAGGRCTAHRPSEVAV